MSGVMSSMDGAFVQFLLVVSVCVQLCGADSVCECSVSGTVMDCSYRNCPDFKPKCTEDTTVLKMTGNGITHLPSGYFENCISGSIKEVYLDNNNISQIDKDAFQGLEEVNYVDLSGNNISALDVDLQFTEKLTDLSLAGNPLQTFTFHDTMTLKNLNLSSCQLPSGDNIVSSLKELRKLTTLDLSSNKLTNWDAFSEYVVESKELKFLYVADNPWECKCPRDETTTEKMKSLVDGGDPKCAVTGNSLWEFTCPFPTTTTTTTTITTSTTTTESATTITTSTTITESATDTTTKTTFPSSDVITTQPSPTQSSAVIRGSSDVIALACLCATSFLVLAAILVYDYLRPADRDQWIRTLLNVQLIPKPGIRWHALCPAPGDSDGLRFEPTVLSSRRK